MRVMDLIEVLNRIGDKNLPIDFRKYGNHETSSVDGVRVEQEFFHHEDMNSSSISVVLFGGE